MQITLAAKTLLFEQQQFFRKESFSGHLTLPALLTLLYACIAAVCTSGGNIFSGVGTAVMIVIAWIVVAAVFYLAIKVIGHTECRYTPILAATGYASVPFLIGTLVTSIVTTTVGGFSTTLIALMTIAVLFWCIPIWVYAVSAVINLPAKAVLHILLLPILLIFVVELGSIITTGSPLAAGISSGNSGVPVAADPGISMGSGGGMSFSMGTASGPGMGGGPGPR